MKEKKPQVTDFNPMLKYDKYELMAIGAAKQYIQEYVIMKTIQPVKGVCKLITVGRREKLCIMYHRAGDPYFLELTMKDCKEIMKD